MNDLSKKNELEMYRHNTIVKFLNEVLEVEAESAKMNASFLEKSLSEDVLIKFVHFFDFMTQKISNSSVSDASCNGCCGSCHGNCGGA